MEETSKSSLEGQSAKHTPGPWALRRTESNEKANFRNGINVVIESADTEICWLTCPDEVEQANARLMAKSPELARLLKHFLTVIASGELTRLSPASIKEANKVLGEAGVV
jgi:hypothetical protein